MSNTRVTLRLLTTSFFFQKVSKSFFFFNFNFFLNNTFLNKSQKMPCAIFISWYTTIWIAVEHCPPSGTHIYETSLKVLEKCLAHSTAPECNHLFLSCSMMKETDQNKNRLLLPYIVWSYAVIIFQIFIDFNRVFAAFKGDKLFPPYKE